MKPTGQGQETKSEQPAWFRSQPPKRKTSLVLSSGEKELKPSLGEERITW